MHPCPACGSEDYIRFVFAEHYNAETQTISYENPSDFPVLYICDNLHVRDHNGELIARIKD